MKSQMFTGARKMQAPTTSTPGASLRSGSFQGRIARFFAFTAAVAAVAFVAPMGASASYLPDWSFNGGTDGNFPYAPLTVFSPTVPQFGTLWGTTTQHGAYGYGTMFRYTPSTSSLVTVASFPSTITSPSSQLVPFSFVSIPPPPGNARTRSAVHGGVRTGLVVKPDPGPTVITDFFGTSLGPNGLGTVYRYNQGNQVIQMAHQFTGGSDGKYPKGGLVLYNGWLWGVANAGGGGGANAFGVVYKINPVTNQLFPVYPFLGGNDGAYPNGLILWNNMLYGATDLGGTGNSGTIFSINPLTGVHQVICGNLSAMFGVTSNLVAVGTSQLYFTTWNNFAHGTISGCSMKTHATWTAYNFTGGDDGNHPMGLLSLQGDLLYGTTATGGVTSQLGNVYSYNIQTGVETPIHEFAPGEGGNPGTGVALFNSALWGVTATGGGSNGGTIYSTGLTPAKTRFHPN